MSNREEEELVKRQAIERRQLPKRIRSEMKTRELMFRESLRISMANLNGPHDDERDQVRKFQMSEKERYKAEQQRQEIKHKRQLEDLRLSFEHTLRELEQLQNEKRKALMEHETAKLKQLEDEHVLEFKEWRANLKPRKQVSSRYVQMYNQCCNKNGPFLYIQRLEEEFAHQREEQDRFYGNSDAGSGSGSAYFNAIGMTTSQSQLPVLVSNEREVSHHHSTHRHVHGHHHQHIHERQVSGSNSCTPPSTPGAVERPTHRI